MDSLSEGLREALTPAMAEELQFLLTDMAEEAQEEERVLNMTLERLLHDIKEMERSRMEEVERRRGERNRLTVASADAKREVREHSREALNHLKCKAQRKTEEYEMERERRYALEKELKRICALLEQKEEEDYHKLMVKETDWMIEDSKHWARRTKESEDCTLSITLAAAAKKQRLLRDLEHQAEKWMVSDCSTQGADAPLVFQSWMMREKWRKLQDNKSCLNDGLQSFIFRRDIEKVIEKNETATEQIAAKFNLKMEQHRAQAIKEQERVRAAELQKRMKLEEQTRKELEKCLKAELKEKEKQEAKERKEAEKLEKKRAKEERERARTRRSILHFWR